MAIVIRRNAALLPAYSIVLGLIALLGYMAIAVGVDHDPAHAAGFARYGPNYAVPALFLSSFSSWFVGIAFAGIASVRSYPQRSCQLPERNLYEEFIHPDCTEAQEATMAKIVSLVMKIGAVVFILALPHDYAIQLQLSAASGSSSFCPRSCSGSIRADAMRKLFWWDGR